MRAHSPLKMTTLLVFLTWLNVLNFADRTLLGNLAKQISEDPELDIDYETIGFLTGYGFIIFYTLIGVGMGALADRWHRPRLIAGGLAIWSALTAATGLARNFAQIAGCRALIGIGEAALTPSALSMLGSVFPPRLHAFASGTYYAGIPLGAGIGMIVSGYLLPNYGWRGCFIILGLLGGIFVLPLLLMRDDERRPTVVPLPDEAAPPVPTVPVEHDGGTISEFLKTLRRSPALICMMLGASLSVYMQASTIFILTWVQTERGMTYAQAAPLGGVLYLVGGTLGSLCGGLASDLCQRTFGPSGRLWFLVAVNILFTPVYLLFYAANVGPATFNLLWGATAFGTMVWYGATYSTVPDLAPQRCRATAIASLIFCVNFLGAGPGPWATAWLGEHHSFTIGLTVSAGIGFLALPFNIVAALRYQRDRQLVE